MEKFNVKTWQDSHYDFELETDEGYVSIIIEHNNDDGWHSQYFYKFKSDNDWDSLEWENGKIQFYHEPDVKYSSQIEQLFLKLIKKMKQDSKYRLKLLFYLDKDATHLWDQV